MATRLMEGDHTPAQGDASHRRRIRDTKPVLYKLLPGDVLVLSARPSRHTTGLVRRAIDLSAPSATRTRRCGLVVALEVRAV